MDDPYERLLREAKERARREGPNDVLEYLVLRASNDRLRVAGIEWLHRELSEIVGELNRGGKSLVLEREDDHRFSVGNATMHGVRLTVRGAGFRALTIEAGWPRRPHEGIVRGGLAAARIQSFGGPREEIILVCEREGAPRWMARDAAGHQQPFTVELLRARVAALLDG
ncbi:MAG: hypothetical protein C4334_09830 [Pyrinomonas sp.]|uniref:hypothetical protein n=1 Tax=Pyrinomonas sp. TaxID=2080306 RepID=UPI00331E0ED5